MLLLIMKMKKNPIYCYKHKLKNMINVKKIRG